MVHLFKKWSVSITNAVIDTRYSGEKDKINCCFYAAYIVVEVIKSKLFK